MGQPLLSVIVPCYNVEKYVENCLHSILGQSYKNIEVICVDDASPDNSIQLIQKIAAEDNRLKIIRHEKNRGLFHARLTGVSAAAGDYIAFVDSDDYVSCDWFRPLIEKAEAEMADMVLGNTINVDETGRRTYYNNYRSFNYNKKPLVGDALIKSFFAQKGECFIWHTVWNKVYKKQLFDIAWDYLIKMPEPLIMGEDIAFSTVFYSLANKLVFCNNDCYFYYRHKEASTSITLPRDKILKNVKDIVEVFNFVEKFLKSISRYEELKEDFIEFKEKYFRIWSGNIYAAKLQDDREVTSILLKGFNKNKLSEVLSNEFYFYDLNTDWDDKLEEIKYALVYGHYKAISFDIFDTLIKRPLWEPRDVLYFVALENRDLIEDAHLFYAMRLEAEDICRKTTATLNKETEDVTLSEIYECFKKEYGFTQEDVKKLQDTEERLEIKICEAREIGRELFNLAKYLGYEIVLTSDMYLDKRVICEILDKCDYSGYKALFLSSERRKLKSSGSLYNCMLREMGYDPSYVLHIGDNWGGDVISAQKVGIKSKFLPKAIEVFTNTISDIYTGDTFKNIYFGNNDKYDSSGIIKQLPLRCLYGLAASNYFDNPFRSFNSRSHYNADAYYIGYAVMGMHIFGLAKWIDCEARKAGYKNIIFLARDGYLVKKVFDMIQKNESDPIASDYFYATRKSLFPYLISAPDDLYSIYEMVDVYSHTPLDILEIFQPVCKELSSDSIYAYKDAGIDLNKKFESKEQFFRFIKNMIKLSYSGMDSLKLAAVKQYFKNVFSGNCATFDIGYSGRLQKIICNLADKPIDVFYVHDNGYDSQLTATDNGFKIYNFYEYTPKITAILREYLISDPLDYCCGYTISDMRVVPELKQNNFSYAETYAINEMHRGVLDYCKDVLDRLKDKLNTLHFRPQDISAAFENFLTDAPDFDRRVFSASPIEDVVYSGYQKKNFYEIWTWHLQQLPRNNSVNVVRPEAVTQPYAFLEGKSKIVKALFYFLFDRKNFKRKYKEWKVNSKK